jgi:tetratricopeptide (TPR) repeat protein
MPADFTGPDPTPAPDDPSLRPTVAPDPADSPAVVIGRYKLLHRIGEGGMGEVWLSEQTEPVRRRVALKLLKAELIGREAILRFESERQALALMATLASLHGLAWTYQYQRRFAEAEPIWAQLLDTRRRVMGAQHPDTLTGWMMLALVRLEQQRFADAESTSRELLAAYQKSFPDNWRRIYTQAILGASLAGERKYEEAEPTLTSAYDSLVEKRDSMLAEFRPSIAEWGERIRGDVSKLGPGGKGCGMEREGGVGR